MTDNCGNNEEMNTEELCETVGSHDDSETVEAAETVAENIELAETEADRPESVKEPDNMEAIVEGLLYVVGDDGIRIEQLSEAIGSSFEDTEVIIRNIQQKYASELFGIELVGYGNVYKFITKKSVYPYVQELFHTSKQNTLSQSALETLAIIAYKQPVTRVEIEELRGVGAEMMLRKLQARNLIKEAGRSEAPGRPILYEVTEEFMDSFKLYTLNELPELPDFGKDHNNTDLFE